MAKRRGNKEGTIYERKDGRWCAQVTVGWDAFTGKQQRKTVYGATRQEVQDKLDDLRGRVRNGTAGAAWTVKAVVEWWLIGAKGRLEPTTHERYGQDVVPILAHLGARPVADLTKLEVSAFYSRLAAEGMSTHKVMRTAVRLRQILKAAVRMGVCQANPADSVDRPRHKGKQVRPLTAEQARRLLEVNRADPYYALYATALDSGARQGELFALTVADVDLERGELLLSKSLQNKGGALRVKETKTPKGRRRVLLSRPTVEALRRHLEGRTDQDGPAFRSPEGGYLQKTNFRDRDWKPALRRASLVGVRFHDLRHTCATLLLLANVHPKVVSERLGHASIELTLNTYSHLLPTMQAVATEALEGVLYAPQRSTAVKQQSSRT